MNLRYKSLGVEIMHDDLRKSHELKIHMCLFHFFIFFLYVRFEFSQNEFPFELMRI